jgi:hypothetical protein
MGIATKSRFCLEMANAGTRVTRSRILLKYITTEVRVFFFFTGLFQEPVIAVMVTVSPPVGLQ